MKKPRSGGAFSFACDLGKGVQLVAERASGSCFAFPGESPFSNVGMPPTKGNQNACPCIRPRLRRGTLASSLLRGHGTRGHPWPHTPLAASMPLVPLTRCARPSGQPSAVTSLRCVLQRFRSASQAAESLPHRFCPVSGPCGRQDDQCLAGASPPSLSGRGAGAGRDRRREASAAPGSPQTLIQLG